MRRQVKVGVYQTKIPKRVFLTTCVASRRNKRGLGINEETALLSPWQWRFEVDRMQSRFASNVDMRTCQPARFWVKRALFVTWSLSHSFVYVVAGEEGNEEDKSDLSLLRSCLRLMRGLLCSYVREIGVALHPCFYSGRRDMCVCFLCFPGAFTWSKSYTSRQ